MSSAAAAAAAVPRGARALPFVHTWAAARRPGCATLVPRRAPVVVGGLSRCAAARGFGSSRRLFRDGGETHQQAPGEALSSEQVHEEKRAVAFDTAQEGEAIGEQTASTQPPGWPANFAFAFDIDGVLLHKSDPIPGAKETLKYLQQHEIPFILLTNGGGKTEATRLAELSSKLDVPLSLSHFVQSHTPFQLLASPELVVNLPHSHLPRYLHQKIGVTNLRNSTVLVLGSDASVARQIAHGYGFQSVVTAGDILKAKPDIFPFDPLTEFYNKQEILPLPKPIYDPKANPSLKLEDCLKIDAILVFNDPRDWAVDIQLIIDLLTSERGYLGTQSSKPLVAGQWKNDGQPALVYSNSDVLWSTGYHLPRFGQGAFQAAVRGAFKAVAAQTGQVSPGLQAFAFGKPELATYAYASNKFAQLSRVRRQEWENRPQHQATVGLGEFPRLRNVYMVGDNPESDIKGAVRWSLQLDNEKRRKKNADRRRKKVATHQQLRTDAPVWQACLVRTGVWSEDSTPVAELEKRGTKPDTVQKDVKAVVNWVFEKEGWPNRVE
ncbi:unnamed protein product [Discula destructiva]